MSELAAVQSELVGDSTVVRIRGEVDLSNAWSVGGAVRDAISNQAHSVVVDLTEVSYLDSAGIRVLFDLSRGLAEHDQQLIVVLPVRATIRRALEVSAIHTAAQVVGSLDEASGRMQKE
jgi:anti-anti-sigma factor